MAANIPPAGGGGDGNANGGDDGGSTLNEINIDAWADPLFVFPPALRGNDDGLPSSRHIHAPAPTHLGFDLKQTFIFWQLMVSSLEHYADTAGFKLGSKPKETFTEKNWPFTDQQF